MRLYKHVSAVEALIGHEFADKQLIGATLTHPKFVDRKSVV